MLKPDPSWSSTPSSRCLVVMWKTRRGTGSRTFSREWRSTRRFSRLDFVIRKARCSRQHRRCRRGFSCEKSAKSENESFASIASGGRRILVAAFPISSSRGRSYLVILTDLSFAAARSSQVLAYLLAALAGVVLVLTVGTIIFAVLMMRGWMKALRRAVEEVRRGAQGVHLQLGGSSIDREIHKLLRSAEQVTLQARSSGRRNRFKRCCKASCRRPQFSSFPIGSPTFTTLRKRGLWCSGRRVD
ncbi:hypothetical protein ACVWZR_000101 [Bradyrhizobium sp. i1.3.1]